MLKKQFRMEKDIAGVANMYYGEYGGLESPSSNKQIRESEEFYGWYAGKQTKNNIHLVDTESLHAWVTGVPQGKGHSRLNILSAAIDVEIAFKLIEKKLSQIDPENYQKETDTENGASILIIAPYKAHITYIKQLIELEYRERGFHGDHPYFIDAGTIHRFQGTEADIVIFDLVVDEPHWKTNLFISDEEANEALKKMFNVAITRAKFKMYIIGNFSYCQRKAKNNALAAFLDHLITKMKLKIIDVKQLIPEIVFVRETSFSTDEEPTGKKLSCTGESFDVYFRWDLRNFKRTMLIFSAFMTQNRIAELQPYFIDAINSGRKIIIVTKSISDRAKGEVNRYSQCEKELKALGVKIIYKKNMHEKLIFIDNTTYWNGSLNALSFTGSTGEYMERVEDPTAIATFKKMYPDIEQIINTVEQDEYICPICNNELILRNSSDDRVYWECVVCGYKRNTDQQYPRDGILRCKCGGSYTFAMKAEPRWICTQNPKHYARIRESDLKLEKMAALIPADKLDEVKKYFEQRRKENSTI